MHKLKTGYTMKKRNASTKHAKYSIKSHGNPRNRSTKIRPPHHLIFTHPHIIQKPNAFGIGTYARKPIPKGTILIKERPHNVTAITRDDPNYIFTLIKHLLSHSLAKFISLAPLKLDDVPRYKYQDIQSMHKKHLPHLTEHDALLYYTKYKRNAFRFGDNPGILFYATRLNHSCSPNVSYMKNNDHIVFTTTRDLVTNDEIFDSYINPNMSTPERKNLLYNRYGFHCGCEKCSMN